MVRSILHLHHAGTTRRFWWVLGILALVSVYLPACMHEPSTSFTPLKDCVDFEDLKVGTKYPVPSTIADSGATMGVLPFQRPGGGSWTNKGHARVEKAVLPGAGNEIFLANVNLGFDVGSFDCVTLRFHDKGGNVNLIINNSVGNYKNFQDVNLGGVNVSVALAPGGKQKGTIKLHGKFVKFNFQGKWLISFAIGGQELAIDDVCPCK